MSELSKKAREHHSHAKLPAHLIGVSGFVPDLCDEIERLEARERGNALAHRVARAALRDERNIRAMSDDGAVPPEFGQTVAAWDELREAVEAYEKFFAEEESSTCP